MCSKHSTRRIICSLQALASLKLATTHVPHYGPSAGGEAWRLVLFLAATRPIAISRQYVMPLDGTLKHHQQFPNDIRAHGRPPGPSLGAPARVRRSSSAWPNVGHLFPQFCRYPPSRSFLDVILWLQGLRAVQSATLQEERRQKTPHWDSEQTTRYSSLLKSQSRVEFDSGSALGSMVEGSFNWGIACYRVATRMNSQVFVYKHCQVTSTALRTEPGSLPQSRKNTDGSWTSRKDDGPPGAGAHFSASPLRPRSL
ncbi:hypothetical protein C8R46DRAFT_598535 [Mycena filopes]|nr:hypothetical protein C8R46DRAFT_598535 [Mycena filopes]